jgi:hypothetical protein
MSSSLSRGFYSGIIGGMVAGIWTFIYIIFRRGFFILPEVMSLDFLLDFFVYQFGYAAIFGGIFGLIYSRFYGGIPGKGVMKGFVFGLLIVVLVHIVVGSTEPLLAWTLSGVQEYFEWSILWAETSLKWIPYGIVLGFFYERLKL